ncbi:ferritin-like domain-containing protein [Gramella sp. MAR_2010_147]|uniref:ferritin-like domain-containing protein n=1 Tax=Gramella sp. MAR_2010_147 TaxID=1250205 RepID=UPI00087ADF02|nr:ferritin-like domain-containing protein [Gramella sp. MAR_2010_147]SDR73437.1 Ferritin-like domain-containing protein [Gramella sp. MAR_2010_147]
MNIINFLEGFTTESLSTGKSSRRYMLGTLGSLGKKAALASVPFGMATSTSYAQGTKKHGPPLRLALTLEYLEAEFYMLALESGILPSGKPENIYMQISKHEDAHVALLKSVLDDSGVDTSSPTFDFTAGGMFDPFNQDNPNAYAQLLALAQAFEDTGVRAYKGQAGNLQGTPYLEPALQIHSVEARHASEIRRLRGLEGWITLDQRGEDMPLATQPVYDGEELIVQAGVDLTAITAFDAIAASQSFDEPISGETAVAIASLFINQEE